MGCGSSNEARESAGRTAPPEPSPRGEGARAAAVDQLVTALHAAAVAAEPRVTALLSAIASEYGAAFVGQEHKIKAEGSLRGKVERFAAQIHRKRQAAATDPDTCTWDESHAELYALHTSKLGVAGDPIVVDALRYTMIFSGESYSAGVRALRDRLRDQGLGQVPHAITLGTR